MITNLFTSSKQKKDTGYMKAAVLVAQNRPLVVADIELPKKLKYGQVLVRVVCSGICALQVRHLRLRGGSCKLQ